MSETTKTKKEIVSEITKKYIGEMTMEAFGDSLGINASKQNVNQWLKGKYPPSLETLYAVLFSSHATGQAKAWAGECLAVLQNDAMERRGVN